MIRALNGLRRELGLPTMPTLTGKTRHARALRREWRIVWAGARLPWTDTMEHYRDLEACPDDMLGEPNARELGRFVRMANAVRAGFEDGLRGVP